MPFWDENTGVVTLGADTRLFAHMTRKEITAALAALAPLPAEFQQVTGGPMIPFPAFAVPGGRLACVCLMHGDRLHAATFSVVAVGNRRRGTAEQQRALLFQCLRATDPNRDSKRGVLLRCPFGAALIATDPRSGDATLRLTYR